MKSLIKSYTLLLFAVVCLALICAGAFADNRDNHPGDRPGDYKEFRETGTIAGIDAPGDKLILKTRSGSYDIIIDRTRIQLDNGRSGKLQNLKHGDEITVVGEQIQHNKVKARSITVINSKPDRKPNKYDPCPEKGRCDSVEGKVTKTATFLRRTITVSTRYGDVTIKVEKGASVKRDRRDVSIHDINKGETITIWGRWDHKQIVANRVIVTDKRSNDKGYGRSNDYKPDDHDGPRDH